MSSSEAFKKAFLRAPHYTKNIIASIGGYKRDRARTSGEYSKWYEYFSENEKLSVDEALHLQTAKLLPFINSAYENIEYYRELFDSAGLTPESISTVDDLKKIPFLEKHRLAENSKDFLHPNKNEIVYWKSTSGSTGSPMLVPWYKALEQMQWGFVWARARRGVKPSNSYSSFTGLDLVPPGKTKPPFWVDNWASNQRMFSIFHLSDEYLEHYMRVFERGCNDYIVGYGNVLYIVADYVLRSSRQLKVRPKAVFNSSVELQPIFRETIEKAFQCPVWDHYGQVELAGAITEYECKKLHYDMDYSVLEFVPVGSEEGGLVIAEVVATNIHNQMWPLLRYKTGDLVAYHPDDHCDCGRPGRVIRKIYGRTGHYFVTPEGKKITNVTVIAKNCNNIKYLQVVQEKLGEIVVKYVPNEFFGDDDIIKIKSEFRKKVGKNMNIKLQTVKEIERTKSGKYLAIVNRLKD